MEKLARKIFALSRSPTAKHTYWVLSGDVIFTFSTFLATIIIARGLPVSHYGVFAVLLTIIIILVDVADIGVGSALSHFVPAYLAKNFQHKAWSMVKTAIFFEVGVGSLIILITFFGSRYISWLFFNTDQHAGLVRLMGITAALALWTVLLGYILTSLEKFPQRALVNSLPAILRLIIVIILFFSKSITLFRVVVATMISFFPSLILGGFFIGQNWWQYPISLLTFKQLLSFSSFIGISRGLTAISSRLDLIMLSSMVGSFEAGIYGAASRMSQIFPLVAGSFSAVIAPKFAKLEKYGQLYPFIKKIMALTAIFIAGGFLLMIFAPFLVMLTFGEEYRQSIDVFRLLIIPNLIFLATLPTVNLLIFRFKKPYLVTYTTIVQLITIVISNLYFIPKFGRFGPIPGLILSFSQVLIVTGFFSFINLKQLKNGN